MKLAGERLGIGYPGKPVGRDISLSIEPGTVMALLGPNGGGKTTLFKVMLGLLAPQSGRVLLDDADLADVPRRDVARALGYVPQAHAGYFPFTVLDVVLMGRAPRLGPFATPGARDRDIAAASLDTLGALHLADAIYTRISGGERQLVLIARALAQEPRLLIMDEPTASLDFGNQLRVLDQIESLSRRGIGVIFSTHDPDHAFACADTAALLHDGTIVAAGPPADVITAQALQRLYGVAVDIVTIGRRADGRELRTCRPHGVSN